jgi:hypothetical protein
MLGRSNACEALLTDPSALRHQGLERLLDLPPFVLSLFSSLLLPLPQTLLVSAIATAGLGPGIGLVALALIGTGNLLITAGLSESIVRLGPEASGCTTLPAVALYYLGPTGSRVATFGILTMWFTALVGGMLGFIDVMAGLSNTPQIPWLLGLSVVIVGLNARRSLGFSVMMMLGIVTFLLLLAIAIGVLPHMAPWAQQEFWRPLPQVNPWALPPWSSLVAISFYTFFGVSLLAPSAIFVLPRDPSGATFIRGTIAGALAMMAVVIGWLILVSQVVPRQILQGLKGTVLVSLGGTGHPALALLCASLAITLSGFAAIRAGGVLGNQLRDLPLARTAWGRQLLPAVPTLAALLLILGWMDSGTTNLTAALSVGGGLGIPVGCWIVPTMILRQARLKRPGMITGSLGLVGHPIVTTSLLLIGLLVLLMFGLLLWTWWPIKIFTVALALGLAFWIFWLQPQWEA